MASVPNMRLTAQPQSGDAAAPADVPEGDVFARLLGATATLQPIPGLTIPSAPATPEARLPADLESDKSDPGATTVDPAPTGQTVDLLPLVEAQAAAPVTSSPAAPSTEARAPEAPKPAEATARPSAAPPAASPDAPRLDPTASLKAGTAPAPDPKTAMPEAEQKAEASSSPAQRLRTDSTVAARHPRVDGQMKAEAVASEPTTSPARAASNRSARAADAAATPPGDRGQVQAASTQSAAPISLSGAMPEAGPARIAATAEFTRAEPAPEPMVVHELDLAQEGEWLDQLARDIARSRDGDGPMRFRLHPQSLGHLRVELAQTDQGTSVRLTAETEAARSILTDAQPRLLAEARAQGVRIAETHVDLAGSGEHAADPRRQGGGRQDETIRTTRDSAEESRAPAGDRPGRAERYA